MTRSAWKRGEWRRLPSIHFLWNWVISYRAGGLETVHMQPVALRAIKLKQIQRAACSPRCFFELMPIVDHWWSILADTDQVKWSEISKKKSIHVNLLFNFKLADNEVSKIPFHTLAVTVNCVINPRFTCAEPRGSIRMDQPWSVTPQGLMLLQSQRCQTFVTHIKGMQERRPGTKKRKEKELQVQQNNQKEGIRLIRAL